MCQVSLRPVASLKEIPYVVDEVVGVAGESDVVDACENRGFTIEVQQLPGGGLSDGASEGETHWEAREGKGLAVPAFKAE